MLRAITGFVQDEVGDWVARLACGHRQHVRHKPPFWNVPWVVDADARAAKVGTPLSCVLCDRFEMPAGFVAYKRTAEFDAASLPEALRRDHSTKAGVWARIRLIAGRLRYVVEEPLACERVLEPGTDGIVVAEVRHRVEPLGDVRFFVEFYRPESAR